MGSQVTEVWSGGRSETQGPGGHIHVAQWTPCLWGGPWPQERQSRALRGVGLRTEAPPSLA